jgi:lipoate-protein ligase B
MYLTNEERNLSKYFFYIVQFVPHRKHCISVKRNQRLMLLKESAVYSENHMKHRSKLSGQNAEFFNVKAGGAYSYHCVLNVRTTCEIRTLV